MNNTKDVAVQIRANLGTDNNPCFTYIEVGTFNENAQSKIVEAAKEAVQYCNHILTWEILKDGAECGMRFLSDEGHEGLRLDVTITGETTSVLEYNLDAVLNFIGDDFTTGSNWYKESSYKFNVHGEELVADIQHDDESFYIFVDETGTLVSFEEDEEREASSEFNRSKAQGYISYFDYQNSWQGELRLLMSVDLDEDSNEIFIAIDQDGNVAYEKNGKDMMEALKRDHNPFWIYQVIAK